MRFLEVSQKGFLKKILEGFAEVTGVLYEQRVEELLEEL